MSDQDEQHQDVTIKALRERIRELEFEIKRLREDLERVYRQLNGGE